MSDTKYRLLCKGSNTVLKTLILNEEKESYTKIEELYSNDHKIKSGDVNEKLAAENERMNFIVNGNDASNPKGNMLFSFGGTKRVSHKKWVAAKTGYVIRDWKSIEDKISKPGDYSGPYIILNGNSPATGIVVAKENPLKNNISISSIATLKAAGVKTINTGIYEGIDPDSLYEYLKSLTIGKLNTASYKSHGTRKDKTSAYNPNGGVAGLSYVLLGQSNDGYMVVGQEAVNSVTRISNFRTDYYNYYTGFAASSAEVYSVFTVSTSQIETIMIPAHYEDVLDSPYMIKDDYERIDGEPWFTYKITGSLESAIETAKRVIEAIGLENVMLIKEVSLDQKIKIS